MNTVRWGIIGCGNVTEVKSGPGFQNAGGSSLVAVMRRNGALAEDYAHRHGVPRWYDDADALLRDPEVDAVYVATPPSSHRPYVEMAAARGKPVYVEKPMATTGADCDAMRSACRDAGVPLFVAYYRRALPRFLQVRDVLADSAIGEPLVVAVTHLSPPSSAESGSLPGWRVSPEIAGGGYFVDLGSHTLDLLDFLLGPVERADGSAANRAGLYRAEDLVTARLTFASGVHGVGVWSFTSAEQREHVEIFGTHGTLRFSVFADVPVTLSRNGREEALPYVAHPRHVQQPLIQTVVDALARRGTCPSTGDSAARTGHVIDRLLADHRATLDTVGPPGVPRRPAS